MRTQSQGQPRLAGMIGFFVIWIGQIVSVLASGMTSFAMTIYMYQQTRSATAMGFVQVAYITPFLIMSPIAGVLVDRYNRKLMMMVSDIAGGIATLSLFILYATGHLQYWHIYIAVAVSGIGTTFQWPAYSAAISTMVSKEQYGRANGMMSLIEAGPGVLSPFLAGALIPIIQIGGILLIDSITFWTAIFALALVFVPQPRRSSEGDQAKGSFWKEAAFGFKYIFARPSLLGLQLVFFFGNLFAGIGFTVLAPMLLARTSQNALVLGSVESAASIGMVAGGIAMSAWGGFKKRVHGVLLGWIFSGLLGNVVFGLGRGLPVWAPAVLLGGIFVPIVNGSNQAIWQAKVAPDLQGRVFSARRLIAWFTNPISPIIGGTLSDFVLEPAMKAQASGFARFFAPAFGSGPGSGMSLLIFICGLAILLVGLAGYFVPAIREADTILADHDAPSASEGARA
ncbi:MAG TPA: MFS transporter [Anaerolineales bacterium]|nr:MFS transporter [Anaerolineales bacterium]